MSSSRGWLAMLGATLACLGPPRVAHALQAHMGDMPMRDWDRRGPSPAICRLLSGEPVVVPASAEQAAFGLAPPPLLRVVDARGRHELVIEVGPVDVPAHAMADRSRDLVHQLAYFPLDAWVHGFRLELTDGRGRTVPRRVLHHIDTMRPSARDLFLPVAQRFVALGAETAPERLPSWLVGVPIHAGEPVIVSSMLHNPTDTSYRGVRLRLILAYTPARPLYEVAGFRLDVMFPTGPMEYDLPPGRSVRWWEGSPQVPARIIAMTGHLHQFAEWIALEDRTTGELLWRAEPRVNSAAEVTGMPVWFPRLGLGHRVLPTHRYRVTASYWNPTGHLIREGAMAKVAGIFTPSRPLPPVDVHDPLYQEDLRYVLGSGCGASGQPHLVARVPQTPDPGLGAGAH